MLTLRNVLRTLIFESQAHSHSYSHCDPMTVLTLSLAIELHYKAGRQTTKKQLTVQKMPHCLKKDLFYRSKK